MIGAVSKRRFRRDITYVECWFYVRIFSGVSATNTTTDRQSPALTHGDLKFGITVSMPQREALYCASARVQIRCAKIHVRQHLHLAAQTTP
jgi:hypothetical protein